HRPVLGFQHRGLGFALLGLAHLVRFGLLYLQARLGRGNFGLGAGFTGDGLGIGVRSSDTHGSLGVLHLGIALEARRLLADLLLLVELSDADSLLPLRFLHLGFALERRCLLADFLLFFELSQAHRLLALVFASADFAELDSAGHRDCFFALGFSDADL